jgi:hypothetical protein
LKFWVSVKHNQNLPVKITIIIMQKVLYIF